MSAARCWSRRRSSGGRRCSASWSRWAEETAFLARAAGSNASVRFAAAAAPRRRAHRRLHESRIAPSFAAGCPKRCGIGDATRRRRRDRAVARRAVPRRVEPGPAAATDGGELALPVEALLEAGGDERIVTAPESGMNRYGATSRPRPEAVHFSSSTASSVSDYVFAALDRLRRALLVETLFGGTTAEAALARLADAISAELLAMHDLGPDEADVVLAPSGTDTELLAVLVALGAGASLANLLVAPEETGRAVKIAAAGLGFQRRRRLRQGRAALARRRYRGRQRRRSATPPAAPQPRAAVESVRQSWASTMRWPRAGACCCTCCSAPRPASARRRRNSSPRSGAPGKRVDVVADSCQGRISGPTLGAYVRAGWMAQISGSKFFTGPPFSGALLIPARLRDTPRGGRAPARRGACARADRASGRRPGARRSRRFRRRGRASVR